MRSRCRVRVASCSTFQGRCSSRICRETAAPWSPTAWREETWNRLARAVSEGQGLDVWENARLFGLLNIAMKQAPEIRGLGLFIHL